MNESKTARTPYLQIGHCIEADRYSGTFRLNIKANTTLFPEKAELVEPWATVLLLFTQRCSSPSMSQMDRASFLLSSDLSMADESGSDAWKYGTQLTGPIAQATGLFGHL